LAHPACCAVRLPIRHELAIDINQEKVQSATLQRPHETAYFFAKKSVTVDFDQSTQRYLMKKFLPACGWIFIYRCNPTENQGDCYGHHENWSRQYSRHGYGSGLEAL
jgi:hypothetical protein